MVAVKQTKTQNGEWKTTRDRERYPIIEFKKPGDSIIGKFLGVKRLPSKFDKTNGSILWKVKLDNGEIVLVNEKATMKDLRTEVLADGDDIKIVYNGIIDGDTFDYKDMEVFLKKDMK